VPLAYYVATASANGGLYEEGTFVAAARSLGVPHPPGAPVTTIVSAFAALLPIGPLSYRVAVTSAVFSALTLALFARTLFFTLRSVGVGRRREQSAPAVGWLALAGAWFIAQTPMFYAQATRPNVYAAQFALALLVLDATIRFELSEPSDDRRPLYLGAFVQGLAFANHHVFAWMMLAAVAPTLGRIFARRGFLGLMATVAAPIIGFSAWIYVPIRGGKHPFINIGEASRLTRTFWVLNADPWWGPPDAPEPFVLRQLAQGFASHVSGSVVLFVLALVGLLLASRAQSQRRFALLWLITIVVPLASVAWILEPKLILDAWGTLIPCAFGIVALATTGLGLMLQSASKRIDRAFRRGSISLSVAALAMLVVYARSRGLARFDAPDLLDDLARRQLPTRAVVLNRDMGAWFRHLGAEAEERLRADVTFVPLAALRYPHVVEAISENAPELAPLLNDAQIAEPLALSSLRGAGERRPLFLSIDDQISIGVYPWLEHDGLYERVRESEVGADRGIAARETARFEGLHARLGARIHQPEVSALLSRVHLGKAIVSAELHERGSAMMHARLGLAVAPYDDRFARLWTALDERRPFDPSTLWRPEE